MVHFTSIITLLAATAYALPTPEAEPVAVAVAEAEAEPVMVELEKRCTGPKVNQATLTLTENSEGYRSSAYLDPTGHWTIAYGHLCSKSHCADVPYKQPITKAQGQALLAKDLTSAQNCITNETAERVVLNANEYGALVDWAFNEGCGNVASSSLIKRLNKGEAPLTVIKQELPKWVYSNGQKLPGLVTRRNNEVKLAEKATSAKALPAKC